MIDGIVWLDGELLPPKEAKLPVTDHGLLYGDGIFEGIRVYERRVFRLRDHLARLLAGARGIGLEVPGGAETLEKAVFESARALGRDDAYLRLVVTRGDGELGVDPTRCGPGRVFCIAAEARLYPPEKRAQGLELVTASVRKPALDAIDPRVKSLNYLNSVLAKREARLRGADEALVLNAEGRVAEASVANLFVWRGGTLRTPPPNEGCLEGITRASVLEIAAAQGRPVSEEPLSRMDVLSADEVFLTGTGARVVPVASLDGAPIGAAHDRPVFTAIADAFLPFARAHGTPL